MDVSCECLYAMYRKYGWLRIDRLFEHANRRQMNDSTLYVRFTGYYIAY